MAQLGDRRVPMPHFASSLVFSLDRAGGIWFSHNREYRISRRTLEGDTTLVFSLPAEAAPVGEDEREYLRKRPYRPQVLAAYLKALPEVKPLIHRILTDDAGHLFVFADVAGTPSGTFVDVFEDDGRYLGRLDLPTPVSFFPLPQPLVAYATAEHLYVVVLDDDDVLYVSRLRLIRGGR